MKRVKYLGLRAIPNSVYLLIVSLCLGGKRIQPPGLVGPDRVELRVYSGQSTDSVSARVQMVKSPRRTSSKRRLSLSFSDRSVEQM